MKPCQMYLVNDLQNPFATFYDTPSNLDEVEVDHRDKKLDLHTHASFASFTHIN